MSHLLDVSEEYATEPISNREKSLWAAVLHQAISDYEYSLKAFHRLKQRKSKRHGDPDVKITMDVRNACVWIFDESHAHLPNSFESVCTLLDLCPVRVRRILKQKFSAYINASTQTS